MRAQFAFGLCLLLLVIGAGTVVAQEATTDPMMESPSALYEATFLADTCTAYVREGTFYASSTQEESIGSLTGGEYGVISYSLFLGNLWLQVEAPETATTDAQGIAWINANESPFTISDLCLANSGFGEVAPVPIDQPPGATFFLTFPYGGCLVQNVGSDLPFYPGVLEDALPELTTSESQYIVRSVSQYQGDTWVEVYGGEAGEPVYLNIGDFVGEDTPISMTPSCLYSAAVMNLSDLPATDVDALAVTPMMTASLAATTGTTALPASTATGAPAATVPATSVPATQPPAQPTAQPTIAATVVPTGGAGSTPGVTPEPTVDVPPPVQPTVTPA